MSKLPVSSLLSVWRWWRHKFSERLNVHGLPICLLNRPCLWKPICRQLPILCYSIFKNVGSSSEKIIFSMVRGACRFQKSAISFRLFSNSVAHTDVKKSSPFLLGDLYDDVSSFCATWFLFSESATESFDIRCCERGNQLFEVNKKEKWMRMSMTLDLSVISSSDINIWSDSLNWFYNHPDVWCHYFHAFIVVTRLNGGIIQILPLRLWWQWIAGLLKCFLIENGSLLDPGSCVLLRLFSKCYQLWFNYVQFVFRSI